MAPTACGKFHLPSKFLKLLSHLAFVDGTFTKVVTIHSTIDLQHSLTIYDTVLNKILYRKHKNLKDSPVAK